MSEFELRALPMEAAPHDGRPVRLLVEWPTKDEMPDGPWGPLDDATRSWTIGFNSEAETGENVWQFVGWNWSYDEFTNHYDVDSDGDSFGVTLIGWLPLDEASTDGPDPTLEYSDRASAKLSAQAALARYRAIVEADYLEAEKATGSKSWDDLVELNAVNAAVQAIR